MASKRSCFNPTLLKKNLLRLWPCWAGTLLLAILILPVGMARNFALMADREWVIELGEVASYTLDNMFYIVLGAAVALGLIVAALLCRYLFTSRSANFYHSLPIRREGLLLTNIVSGLIILWAPMIVTAAVTACVELAYGVFEPVSLFQLLGFYLCASLLFFGMAMICMHLTGMMFAGIALYVILNALVVAVYYMFGYLISLFLTGYVAPKSAVPLVRFLTPLWNLFRSCTPVTEYLEDGSYLVRLPGLGVAGIYGAIGLAMLGLTVLIARVRKSESADDLIAFGWMRPVFKVVFSTLAGILLCIFTLALYDLPTGLAVMLPILLAWSLVGWLVAEMLVRKSLRVFRKPIFLRWGITAVCIAALLLGIQLDPFGIETRIPAAQDVVSVTVSGFGRSAKMTDPAHAIALHEVMVEYRDELSAEEVSNDYYNVVRFEYQLRGGNQLERRYFVPSVDTFAEMETPQRALYDFVMTPEVSLALALECPVYESEQLRECVVEYRTGWDEPYHNLEMTPSQAWQLYQAFEQDVLDGNFHYGHYICQEVMNEPEAPDARWEVNIEFSYQPEEWTEQDNRRPVGRYNHWLHINVTEDMIATLACLRELGLPDEAYVPLPES